MTKIQETLVALPEEKKALFIPAFGDVDKFYTTVYLIARNEHVTELEKPDRYEDRLQVIRQIRGKVEKDRPYQSDFYRAGFNAIPRQAREQDSFDTLPS